MKRIVRRLPYLALLASLASPVMAQDSPRHSAPSPEVEGDGASLRGEEPTGAPQPARGMRPGTPI